MALPKVTAGNSVGPLLKKFRVPVAVGAGVIVLLVGGLFGYQWFEASQKEERARQEESVATWFGRDIAGGIEGALEPVIGALDADVIGQLLKQGDGSAVQAKAQELAALSGDVMGVRIVAPGHEETDYDSFPPVSYAVLALLRQSEETGKSPGVEIHFKGEDTENIAALQRIA